MKLIFLVLTLGMVGPGRVAAQEPTNESAEAADVRAVAHRLMAADSARSVEQVVALYADDAIMLPPGEPAVEGIDAIRRRYGAFFESYAPGLYFLIDESVVVEDLAYVRGRTRGAIRNLATQSDQIIDDVFLMILRRSTDGHWRISRLMFHAAKPEG